MSRTTEHPVLGTCTLEEPPPAKPPDGAVVRVRRDTGTAEETGRALAELIGVLTRPEVFAAPPVHTWTGPWSLLVTPRFRYVGGTSQHDGSYQIHTTLTPAQAEAAGIRWEEAEG